MKIQNLINILPIFLVGCNYPMHGTLDVKSPLTFRDHHGKRSFQLAPGDHSMDVRRKDDFGRTELKMKLFDSEGKVRKVKIHVPDSVTLPDYEGSFALTSGQIDQPFNLAGKIKTVETDYPRQVSSEPCGYGYGYYYGSYYTGTRLITSHQHDKTLHVSADFKDEGSDKCIAKYKGSNTQSQLVIDAVGPCVSP
ncbi:MAG: hypothetical protein ABIQ95_02800 [Bdellovibrionia bacterium]